MLDLNTLKSLELSPVPWIQRVVGTILRVNYALTGTRVVLEGQERLPLHEPVILAMNHTDRFNMLPFQYVLHRDPKYRHVVDWAKGKYYGNPMFAWVLQSGGMLPVPSRGYISTKDFQLTLKRLPNEAEYEVLRDWRQAPEQATRPSSRQPDLLKLWETPRDVLGMAFNPGSEPYPMFMERLFDEMMRLFMELNRQALFEKQLNILIFPQGTRSVRLSEGHAGIAQLALATGVPIIPIGCNGSDRAYPANSPWAKRAIITYRIGEPLTWDGALAPFKLNEPFVAFRRADEARHRERFHGIVELVMERINGLLDPEYQFAADRESDGVQGAKRFV